MKIEISSAQLTTLEAADRGEVSTSSAGFLWWRDLGDGRTPHSVTGSARILLRRGLIREAETADGRIVAILTDLGREVLAELARRGPVTEQEGTPAP